MSGFSVLKSYSDYSCPRSQYEYYRANTDDEPILEIAKVSNAKAFGSWMEKIIDESLGLKHDSTDSRWDSLDHNEKKVEQKAARFGGGVIELKNPFFNSLGTGKNAFVSNGILGNIVNNYSSDQIETITSELQINHVMDYYLKLYTKTTIEMDLKETNFTLYPNAFEENTIDNDQKIINFYDKVNNDVLNTLETIVDPSENFQKQFKRTKKILSF